MKRILMTLALVALSLGAFAKNYEVVSPDGKIAVTVSVGELLSWSVKSADEVMLTDSRIGMELRQGNKVYNLGVNPKVKNVNIVRVDEMHTAIVPTKFRNVRDYCNQLTLNFSGG